MKRIRTNEVAPTITANPKAVVLAKRKRSTSCARDLRSPGRVTMKQLEMGEAR